MADEPFDDWVREMDEQIEATRRSEALTAADFAVTINATSDDFGSAVDELRRARGEKEGGEDEQARR